MCTLFFVPADQTFFGHDLEEFQNSGLTHSSPGFELVERLAHGTGSARPQDSQDFEFRVRGERPFSRGHAFKIYEEIRNVNEKVRRVWDRLQPVSAKGAF